MSFHIRGEESGNAKASRSATSIMKKRCEVFYLLVLAAATIGIALAMTVIYRSVNGSSIASEAGLPPMPITTFITVVLAAALLLLIGNLFSAPILFMLGAAKQDIWEWVQKVDDNMLRPPILFGILVVCLWLTATASILEYFIRTR
jgi:hypothetical protein